LKRFHWSSSSVPGLPFHIQGNLGPLRYFYTGMLSGFWEPHHSVTPAHTHTRKTVTWTGVFMSHEHCTGTPKNSTTGCFLRLYACSAYGHTYKSCKTNGSDWEILARKAHKRRSGMTFTFSRIGIT
jgi:hypothetical protein